MTRTDRWEASVGGSVYTVHQDGTGWKRYAEGGYEDRLAWQPLVTPAD